MDDARQENPNLVAFLEERLPQLGLDAETYGGYVLGTFNSLDKKDNTDDEDDELDSVIQLLRASSEEYGDDEAVWEQLENDIQSKLQLDHNLKLQKEAEHRQRNKELLQSQLAQAKQEQAQAQELAATASKSSSSSSSTTVDDAAKQALLNRFAFEEDIEGGTTNTNTTLENGADGGAVWNNKQLAAQANLEKAKELRQSQKGQQTKKEEQQKTKEQKQNKQQLKEERRKKATKGERKR